MVFCMIDAVKPGDGTHRGRVQTGEAAYLEGAEGALPPPPLPTRACGVGETVRKGRPGRVYSPEVLPAGKAGRRAVALPAVPVPLVARRGAGDTHHKAHGWVRVAARLLHSTMWPFARRKKEQLSGFSIRRRPESSINPRRQLRAQT